MRTLTRFGITVTFFGLAGAGLAASPALAFRAQHVPLKEASGTRPRTASGFSDEDCGGLDLSQGTVWHFVANGLTDGSVAVTFTAQFGPTANTVTETTGDVSSLRRSNDSGTNWQFFVQSTQPVLVDAVAEFDRAQPAGIDMQLSHICPRTGGTPTQQSIHPRDTAPTTAATTSGRRPPACSAARPRTRTEHTVRSGARTTTQAQPLPRTGTANVPLVLTAVALIVVGLTLTQFASNGHPLAPDRRVTAPRVCDARHGDRWQGRTEQRRRWRV